MEKQQTILWIDDDIDVALSSFIDELKEADYHVLRAQTPDKAWQLLKENSISAIIMDVMLPTGKIIDPITSQRGMYVGLRLLEKIKGEPKYAKIPALIFTILNKDKEVTNWAQKNGIKVLLKLEIYPEELLKAIEELLGKKENSKP